MGPLEDVYNKYKTQGFAVLDFPSNTFNQESYTNQELKTYAATNNFTYPFFAKTNVNGDCASSGPANLQCGPLSGACCPENSKIYSYLKSVLPGDIVWNYAKFLVGKNGIPIKRYLPITGPPSIVSDIEACLKN